jgi:hypothetical protein
MTHRKGNPLKMREIKVFLSWMFALSGASCLWFVLSFLPVNQIKKRSAHPPNSPHKRVLASDECHFRLGVVEHLEAQAIGPDMGNCSQRLMGIARY